jgi:hypothetical protein
MTTAAVGGRASNTANVARPTTAESVEFPLPLIGVAIRLGVSLERGAHRDEVRIRSDRDVVTRILPVTARLLQVPTRSITDWSGGLLSWCSRRSTWKPCGSATEKVLWEALPHIISCNIQPKDRVEITESARWPAAEP